MQPFDWPSAKTTRSPGRSTTQELSAASASAKPSPSSLLARTTKKWWWAKKMSEAEVRQRKKLPQHLLFPCQIVYVWPLGGSKWHSHFSPPFSRSPPPTPQVKAVSAKRRLWLFSLFQILSALSASGQCSAVINNALEPRPHQPADIQQAECHAALLFPVVSLTHMQSNLHDSLLTSKPPSPPPPLSLKGCFSSQSRLPVVTPSVKSALSVAWTTTSDVPSANSRYKRCAHILTRVCIVSVAMGKLRKRCPKVYSNVLFRLSC